MIRREGRQWKTTTANLATIAVRLGAVEDYQAHISRNRRERAAWHAYLDRFLETRINENDLYEEEWDEYWLPPPADDPANQRFQQALYQAA